MDHALVDYDIPVLDRVCSLAILQPTSIRNVCLQRKSRERRLVDGECEALCLQVDTYRELPLVLGVLELDRKQVGLAEELARSDPFLFGNRDFGHQSLRVETRLDDDGLILVNQSEPCVLGRPTEVILDFLAADQALKTFERDALDPQREPVQVWVPADLGRPALIFDHKS